MEEENKISKYLLKIIKDHPAIKSGRKDYLFFSQRISKNIKLIEKFMKKSKK